LRELAINADDFGFTHDVNAGIMKAHLEGVLTSTTLMANGDAFDDAVRLARETPTLDVGCHLVLVQGVSLSTGRPLPKQPVDLLIELAKGSLDIRSEFRFQCEKIISAGIKPTHLDTHKHTHLVPRVFREVVRVANEFAIPYVRLPLDRTATGLALAEPFYRKIARQNDVLLPDYFMGFRLTGSLTEKTLLAAMTRLQDGFTELMCHPGIFGPELASAHTRLKHSRALELNALTSPLIRQAVVDAGIRLRSFGTRQR
jgi:chitin disaccharide deacetylase